MNKEYTAVIKEIDNWWIGQIEEIPGVNCQEKTKEELLKTLEMTYNEFLEFDSSNINIIEQKIVDKLMKIYNELQK